jgi:hypothetical protein
MLAVAVRPNLMREALRKRPVNSALLRVNGYRFDPYKRNDGALLLAPREHISCVIRTRVPGRLLLRVMAAAILVCMAKNTTNETSLDADRVAVATFALMAADREERASGADPRTVEEVLAPLGFTAREVQSLTGGNYETIKTRMRRAKA